MANKVYSDQQMQWGAQLGYYNYEDSDIENYYNQVNADDCIDASIKILLSSGE